MQGINKAIIIGNATADPEVRYSAAGSAVVNVSVATNETWKDKNTGEKKEAVEYHRIVVFGKLAEITGQYLKKGNPVYFEGKLQTRKWQDQSGNDRWSTEIVANTMQLLGSGGDRPAQGNTERSSAQPKPQEPAQDDGFDDIPF